MTDRIKGSNIPFINLSKENLNLMLDALEENQAGKIMFALARYIYEGIEPSFETKIEKSVWNNILMLIDRKADSYFKKAAANRENGRKGGRPKKEITEDIQPNTEFENQEITEENNMGNYIGYIQNITSQVSEIQDTQNSENKVIEVEDNINPQEIKESAPESPNTAINETSDEDFFNVFCEITNNELKTLYNLQKSLYELKKEGKVNTEEYFINREEYYNTIDGYCKDFNKASLKKMRNLIFNTINEKYLNSTTKL